MDDYRQDTDMNKKNIIFPIKIFSAVILVLFGLLLLKQLYFSETKVGKSSDTKQKGSGAGTIGEIVQKKDTLNRDHFHMIDDDTGLMTRYEPICMTCHGTYPHSKEKKVRAFLNFHTGFLACSVCHTRKDLRNKKHVFAWVDHETGDISDRVEGGYGKFPAKIFPVEIRPDGSKVIVRPVEDASAREYLRLKNKLTPDQIAQAKVKLHEHISEKPVFCTECHKKDGYFNFAQLGFPKNRIDHLTSTEVASMIDKYTTFYMPSVIDFGTER